MNDRTEMSRCNLSVDEQRKLIGDIEATSGLGAEGLARVCAVHPRTFCDWRRGKFRIPESALRQLCARGNVAFPDVEILPDYWSTKKAGRLGALARYKIYGNPGTLEGRRKAGQLLRKWIREHPEAAEKGGVAVAKKIKEPLRSPLLAEFVGILIGDGSLRNRFQVSISYDRSKDRKYAEWLRRAIKRLFGLGSFQVSHKESLGEDLVISSVRLVHFLGTAAGLRPGNKLRNGLDLPPWIWRRRAYQIACLRGLMDTDGGPFVHRYQVNGKRYAYPKLAFCSMSECLLQSVFRLFAGLGFHPRLARNHQVFLDRMDEVKRFYREIGSRHERHFHLVGEFS